MAGRNFVTNFVVKSWSNVSKMIDKDGRALSQFVGKTEDFDEALGSFTKNINKVVFTLGVAGMAGAVAFATVRAAALEQKLSRVAITMQGTASEMWSLRKGLIAASNITGKTTEELARMAEMAGQAGLSGKLGAEGMAEFADVMSKFQVVSGLGASETGRIFTRLIDQLKLFKENDISGNVLRMKQLASAIQLVGKNSTSGAGEVSRFVEALLPFRQSMNLSLAQLIGIAGAARSFGRVTTELLASQPQRIFKRALIDRGQEFAEVLQMDVESMTHLINTDPFEFLLRLLEGLQRTGKTAADFTRTIDRLGIGTLRTLPMLAGARFQVQKIRDMTKLAAVELKGMGEVLEEDTVKALDNLNSQLKRATTNIDNLAKVMGLPFQAPAKNLLRVFNALTGTVTKLAQTGPGQFAVLTTAILPLVVTSRLLFGIWAMFKSASAVGPIVHRAAGAVRTFGFSVAKLSEPLGFGVIKLGDFLRTFETAGVAMGSMGRMKAVIAAVAGSIKGLLPGLAAAFGIAAGIAAAVLSIGFVFNTMLLPGFKRASAIFNLLRGALKEIFASSDKMTISARTFERLADAGVLDLFRGLHTVGLKLGAMWSGFVEFLPNLSDVLSALGEPVIALVDLFLQVLDIFGIIPANMQGTIASWKFLGRVLGGIGYVIMTVIVGPFKLAGWFVRQFVNAIRQLKPYLKDILAIGESDAFRFLANAMLPGIIAPPKMFYGSTGIGQTAAPSPLPLGAAASPGHLTSTAEEMYAKIKTAQARGATVPAGQPLGTVVQKTHVNLNVDGYTVGRAVQEDQHRISRRRGETPSLFGSSGMSFSPSFGGG